MTSLTILGITEICSFRLFLEEKTGKEIPPKVLRVMFLRNDGLFCFVNICKIGNFKKPFGSITNLPELYFRRCIQKMYFVSTNEKSDF